jgi:hypothetical protein
MPLLTDKRFKDVVVFVRRGDYELAKRDLTEVGAFRDWETRLVEQWKATVDFHRKDERQMALEMMSTHSTICSIDEEVAEACRKGDRARFQEVVRFFDGLEYRSRFKGIKDGEGSRISSLRQEVFAVGDSVGVTIYTRCLTTSLLPGVKCGSQLEVDGDEVVEHSSETDGEEEKDEEDTDESTDNDKD